MISGTTATQGETADADTRHAPAVALDEIMNDRRPHGASRIVATRRDPDRDATPLLEPVRHVRHDRPERARTSNPDHDVREDQHPDVRRIARGKEADGGQHRSGQRRKHDAVPVGEVAEGQRVFGENRVQEAMGKWPPLRAEHPDLELHLIGPLQTNKVKEAVSLFDVIHSVDRPNVATALVRKSRGREDGRALCRDQHWAEPQKAGVLPEEADAFVQSAATASACRSRA